MRFVGGFVGESLWILSIKSLAKPKSAFVATSDPDALEQVKARFLGKSGKITELLKGLGKLPPEEKKIAGAAINVAKTAIETALNELNARQFAWLRLMMRLAEEALGCHAARSR